MLRDGMRYLFNAQRLTLFPGIAISYAVLGFNILGDGLHDVLDPHIRRRG
jgi:peptide/nickel transport system permease protein